MSGRKLRWPGLGLAVVDGSTPVFVFSGMGPQWLGLQWSPGIREGAIQVPENVCPQRWEGCCRGVRLPLTLGEGDGT
jgi:hypothetical protein